MVNERRTVVDKFRLPLCDVNTDNRDNVRELVLSLGRVVIFNIKLAFINYKCDSQGWISSSC